MIYRCMGKNKILAKHSWTLRLQARFISFRLINVAAEVMEMFFFGIA